MPPIETLILLTILLASADAYPQNTLLNGVENIKSVFKTIWEPATFNLYTRENPFGEEQLSLNNTEVLYGSHFNESRPTKFIIHGYSDTGSEAWVRGLIDASAVYPMAANNTRRVGEFLGNFLEFLNRESNLEYKDVHISGHSLGSHVAGCAGAYLNGRIGRITGLDPASPLFETISGIVDPKFRLDATDAHFVDVIHTSGSAFGFLAPLGHADFYPNNGKFPQPGCSFLPTTTYCSHSRAHQFMTESIGSTSGFKARICESWEKYKDGRCDYNAVGLMGEDASTSLRGKFYLITNDAPPFAIQ
ncbi:pancreatic triacylglycerol lipase isoform X2 [Lasioglossum baleicum]|uniref:pancreatic triacylglycerol lipase isoform X2 n=1 Tax=Lasioglossum baleicum TaxID=434251 RepID=UPI003FCEE210